MGVWQVPKYKKTEFRKKANKYCLLIPIINEGEKIKKELLRSQKHKIDTKVDIIICDGGSTDGSTDEKMLKELGINALLVKDDKGKQGAQLRMGLDFALKRGYEGVITIDGNNKDSIEDVPKFIKKLDEGYDLVQGSRFIKGGKAVNTPLIRNVAVTAIHAPVISLTAGEEFTDTTNAYRAYSRNYLMNEAVQPMRDIFETYELLAYLSVRASQLGMKTCEVPVERAYPKKGKTPTKISPIKGNWELFRILFANLRGKYNVNRTPVNVMGAYLMALQFALMILFVVKMTTFGVSGFSDRVMGNSMMYGIDATKRAYLYLFVAAIVPLITYALGKFNSYILHRCDKDFLKLLRNVSLLGVVAGVMCFANSLMGSGLGAVKYAYGFSLVASLWVFGATIVKTAFGKEWKATSMKWAFVEAYPVLLLMMLILHKAGIRCGLALTTGVYAVLSLGLFALAEWRKINEVALMRAFKVMMLAPILQSVFLELYNILNQHEIYLNHKFGIILGIYAITFIIGMGIYFWTRKKGRAKGECSLKWYYPLVLISLTLFANQLPMTKTVEIGNFFEQANHSEAIYEELTEGEVPILENYDAHMFYNEIGGASFGLLNNDATAASVVNYVVVIREIVTVLLIYYLLRMLIGTDEAMILTLGLPLMLDGGLMEFGVVILPILALVNLCVKKQYNLISSVVFFASLALTCFVRLDFGVGIVISTMIMLIASSIKMRIDKKKVLNLVGGFLIVAVVVIVAMMALALARNVNIMERLTEFLRLSLSNMNWAMATLGPINTFSYSIVYFGIPIAVAMTMIYLWVKRKKYSPTELIIVFGLGLFYLANYQRGMIRHNLAESDLDTALSMVLLYFACLIYLLSGRRICVMTASYLGIMVVAHLLISPEMPVLNNNLGSGVAEYAKFSVYDETFDSKQPRMKLGEKTRQEYEGVKTIMDALLAPEETFVDMSNQTLMYMLTGREKPFYVDQSPGILSGETTQEMFLEQLSGAKVPIMLRARDKNLAEDLDGIDNDYRYYLLSEEMFGNYRPMMAIDGYEIWGSVEKYDEYMRKLGEMQVRELIKESEYLAEDSENVKLGMIPYIWGKYDKNKEPETMMPLEEKGVIDLGGVDKTDGNYIKIKAETEQEAEMKLSFEGDNSKREYSFMVEPGENVYFIRVSTFYEWYRGDRLQYELIEAPGVEVRGLEIARGNKLNEK
ncbi:glycosyltransferase family 2 protein [Candidatus Saccharibacteria bacterium]|nr:glycosyltransferase family 2 protein [Candidatus Saccharibacteria bacterium]